MKKIEVYDPALCCSTGVCGTTVDVALVSFAADVEWVRQKGATVERFNLSQQPLAFANNPTVKLFLERSGPDSLPLVLLDGEIALAGRYPTRVELGRWIGGENAEGGNGAKVAGSPPMAAAKAEGSCCSPQKGCC